MSQSVQVKHWLFLAGAIVFEVGGTLIMKLSQAEGWLLTPQMGLLAMYAFIGFSYYCLALSVTGLPVGVAFAFWEGFGLILVTLGSVLIVGEGMSLQRFIALLCVLGGALLVHHGTAEEETVQEAHAVQGRHA